MQKNEMVEAARQFAMMAHVKQQRKYTGEPYVVHTQEVAGIVSMVIDDPEVIAAAHLHDVIEDTKYTTTDIRKRFGERVANLVWAVTDVSINMSGSLAERKAADRDHLAKADDYAQTIKLADLIHNTASICEHDKDFAVKYMKEKEELLKRMTGGHPFLRTIAKSTILAYNAGREHEVAIKDRRVDELLHFFVVSIAEQALLKCVLEVGSLADMEKHRERVDDIVETFFHESGNHHQLMELVYGKKVVDDWDEDEYSRGLDEFEAQISISNKDWRRMLRGGGIHQEAGHKEKIKCPECGKVQRAEVIRTQPFNTYIKECVECQYVITESEWDRVDGKKEEKQDG